MSEENTKIQPDQNPAVEKRGDSASLSSPAFGGTALPSDRATTAGSAEPNSPSGEFELQAKDTEIIFSDNSDPTVPGVDPLLGKVIDNKYRILSKLGSGGMGAVYRGEHTLMGRTVAIKVLHPQFVSNPDLLRRFQHEAQVASKLHHPNAIETYDFGLYRGAPYIVMQFIEGRTLKNLIQEIGPLPLGTVQRFMREVCGALSQAHHLGIVHRDLKPENIMLIRQRDGTESAMLLDFGIAKVLSLDATNPNQTMTRAGTFCGTPKYASPEQVLEKPVDHRADIYTLGVILYEVVSGVTPFDAPTFLEILVKHVNEIPTPLRVLKPDLDISVALDELVLRCLKKDPSERFQSVDDLISELSHVSGTPTPISNITPGVISNPQGTQSTGFSLGLGKGSKVTEGASLGALLAIVSLAAIVLGGAGYLIYSLGANSESRIAKNEQQLEADKTPEKLETNSKPTPETTPVKNENEKKNLGAQIPGKSEVSDLDRVEPVNTLATPAIPSPSPSIAVTETLAPSVVYTLSPTVEPTIEPTDEPTSEPTAVPTFPPTVPPTVAPTVSATPKIAALPRVVIMTDPDGAEVYINDMFKGVTPLTINELAVGSHPIVLKKKSYGDLKTSLLVDPTSDRPAKFVLSPAISSEQSKKEAMKLFRDGNNLYKDKDYAGAASKFERAIELRADAVGSMIALGNCYARLGRKSDALTRYLAAVQTDPAYGPAHYNIAAFYAVTGRATEALNSLEKAISLDSRARSSASREPDFQGLQSDPRFQKLIKR